MSKSKTKKHEEVVSYVSGTREQVKSQLAEIKRWSSQNGKTLRENYNDGLLHLYLNLTKGDIVIVLSLSCLTQSIEELAQFLFACRGNDIGVISIKECYFLDLTPNEYNRITKKNKQVIMEQLRLIANTVLHGVLPTKREAD